MGVKVVPPQFQWIWNSSCQPKHKVLFWMLLHDRVNTRNLLRRKSFFLESYNCALMNCQQEETVFRLFWGCPFAIRCWNYVCPSRDRLASILEAMEDIKLKQGVPFFMDIIILAAWAIWISRNNLTFQQVNPSFQNWKRIYLEELNWLGHRIKKKHATQFNSRLDGLL